MKNKSIWENELKEYGIKCRECNKKEKIQTDICIIGAGITGMTLAYFLKDTDYNVIVIDKGKALSGVTAKTTAKVSFVQQDTYSKLKCTHGKGVAKEYLHSQLEAIEIIKSVIKKESIDCDFCKADAVLFALKNNEINKIKKEEKVLNEFGIKTHKVNDKNIKYGIRVKGNYCFHPIKYLNKIKECVESKIKIYENVIAENITKTINGYIIKTSSFVIHASKVVLACHYPFQIIPGLIPLKTHVKREYVNAAKIDRVKDIAAINVGKNLRSIRYYKDFVIYGSNEHRITSKLRYKTSYDKSRDEFKNYFNKYPEYTWMNQDVNSNDYLPFIGKLKEGLYIATAYNAWGMTNGTIAARCIADEILGEKNKYHKIFKPKRLNVCLFFNSLYGIICYIKSYIEGLFNKNNPSYVCLEGIMYGVYTDENGIKHKVKLICPHMKCPLVFNEEEKTWDCPCHGSRFDIDGNIIEGPAKNTIHKDYD